MAECNIFIICKTHDKDSDHFRFEINPAFSAMAIFGDVCGDSDHD